MRQFHDRTVAAADIQRLRQMQANLDKAIIAAYDWGHLELDHDFYQVSYLPEGDRLRFTISEEVRREILRKLSYLNQERFNKELAQGLHESKKPSRTRSSRSKEADDGTTVSYILSFPAPVQPPLFPVSRQVELWEVAEVAEPGADKNADRMYLTDRPVLAEDARPSANGLSIEAQALLTWFRQQTDWRSRADVLENTGFTSADWPQTIQELLEAGLVERTGEKRGTRYRAKL
ncbi:MAG TPA: hypothetical protein VF173_36590 [Thermoanaerobaculia bacterium]|nr:hypothetical protein [Thermoanaerobaculia bacterium]